MDIKLTFDEKLAENYKSPSQKSRIFTEEWVKRYGFCPSCGYSFLNKYPNNRPVADFYCQQCKEEYELKSKKGIISTKITDGEYSTKIERLKSSSNPNLLILNYDLLNLSVINFFAIPKHFFVPEIIEKRKPLSDNAQRAGWIGSNILLQKIPQAGKIFIIRQQKIEPRKKIISAWKKTLFLRDKEEMSAKGWLLDIMRCIDSISKKEFTLEEIYIFENELQQSHPDNKNIKAKIRQQLQILRDKGYLDFVKRGYYRIL